MTARVVLSEDVHDIVSIVLSDPIMVESQEKFYNSLGLPSADFFDLQRSGNSYSFFSSCLRRWISRKGLEAKFSVLVSILTKEGFGFLADKISEKYLSDRPTEPVTPRKRSSIESNDVSTIVKTVTRKKAKKDLKSKWWPEEKPLVKSFCERRSTKGLLVEELFNTLSEPGNPTDVTSQKVTVSGFGGVGKTTIAKWYAKHYEDKYEHIIWIDSGEGNLIKSFCDLSAELTKVEQSSDSNLIKLARVCFQILEDKTCLFIFDNAERYVGQDGIKDVLPKHERFHSIITSRNREWGSDSGFGQIQQLPLEGFSIHESMSFLKANLKQPAIEEKYLKQLCDLLGNLPLALQIATSALNKHVEFTDYINIIRVTDQIIEKNFDDYENTINTTLKPSLDIIGQGKDDTNRLAYRILLLFGYIQSDNIPTKFFEAVELCESWEIRAAMDLLETYSLVSVKRRKFENAVINCTYSIHRLLQQVIRYNNKVTEEATLKKILSCEGHLDDKVLPYNTFATESLKKEYPKLRAELVDHVQLPGLILSGEFEEACGLSGNIYTDLQSSASRFNHAICLKNCQLLDESLGHLRELFAYVSGSLEYDLNESGLLSLHVEPTQTMVGSQIFITNMLKGDIAEAKKIIELIPNISFPNTDETLGCIIQALNSELYENSPFCLSVSANRIFLKTHTESDVVNVQMSECSLDYKSKKWKNWRHVLLKYGRFTSEQCQSLSTGNLFPKKLTSLAMKTLDYDMGGREIPFSNPWICLNQLEYLQKLDLINCTIKITDAPLPMHLKSLLLRDVSFHRNGEILHELILNELINFCSLKSLILIRHGIEEHEKEVWVVDMTGNLKLDFVKLEGNSISCQNWEDANWTINHLILDKIELKHSKMKIKQVKIKKSPVELSDLPIMIQSLTLDSRVSFDEGKQACFLQNLKYLNTKLPFSLKFDILRLMDKCPMLVGLKLDYFNKECDEFDLNALPSTVRELHLKGVSVTLNQVRHIERLVIAGYTTEAARQIVTKLRPEHLCYNQYIIVNASNDTKLVKLIQREFKSVVLGPISWENFEFSELSSYVDGEGEYYVFENQRGTCIDFEKFSAYLRFPPIER